MKKIIGKGSEAIISLENNIVFKNRIRKSYRIEFLDEKLRKSRTKRESKIINKLKDVIPVPKILKTDEKEEIIMDFIDGKKLSDYIEKLDYKSICKKISINLTKMHDKNIIHGDLTTSNMILKEDKLYFIDFGLSFDSYKIEDKAVDLHLLKQALEAKHFTIWEECWNIILKNYKAKEKEAIIKRIKTIESRGRYKDKY